MSAGACGATILVVLAAVSTTTSSARRRACGGACRRARPHGCVKNRWYPAANCDARVEWDFEDRLVKVTKSDGTVVENVYDVDGVLVRTAVNGVGTDNLVDTSGGLSHVVAEVNSSGAVSVLYVRAGDMLLEEVRGGVAKMYEADGLGSVRGLLDVSGAKTDAYAYEAFGSTLSCTGTDANPYRFAGERLVDSVGMYQNRARWLDTRTGQFVSVDPKLRQTEMPYAYGGASPVTAIDPRGWDEVMSYVGPPSTMTATLASTSYSLATSPTSHMLEAGSKVYATQIDELLKLARTEIDSTIALKTFDYAYSEGSWFWGRGAARIGHFNYTTDGVVGNLSRNLANTTIKVTDIRGEKGCPGVRGPGGCPSRLVMELPRQDVENPNSRRAISNAIHELVHVGNWCHPRGDDMVTVPSSSYKIRMGVDAKVIDSMFVHNILDEIATYTAEQIYSGTNELGVDPIVYE